MRFLPLLALALLFTGCDSDSLALRSEPVAEAQLGGVTFVAVGGATLRVTDEGLEVTGLDDSGEGGVRVSQAAIEQADVFYEALGIPDGADFRLGFDGAVFGQRGRLASILHANPEADPDDVNDISLETALGQPGDEVELRYTLNGTLVHDEVTVLAPGPNGRPVAPMGQARIAPRSLHIIRVGDVVAVGTDWGRGGGRQAQKRLPAVEVTLPNGETITCDRIDVAPALDADDQLPPVEVNGFSLTGRNIERFVITGTEVQ